MAEVMEREKKKINGWHGRDGGVQQRVFSRASDQESCVWGQDESWQQEADNDDNDDDVMMTVRRVPYVDELPARPQSSRLWR